MAFEILVENQIIETIWTKLGKEHYESKGYIFTGYRDKLFVKAEDLPCNSYKKVKIICDYCGDVFDGTFQNYKCVEYKGRLHACKKCYSKKLSDIEIHKYNVNNFIKEFNDWCKFKNYIPITKIETYSGSKKMQFECKIHGIQTISLSQIRNNGGCKYCLYMNLVVAGKNKLTKEEVEKRIGSKNNNKLINSNDYVDITTKNLRVLCGSCNHEFITSLASIVNGDGKCHECSIKCVGQARTYIPDKVESIINSFNNNILLNKDDYINSITRNLRVLCGCGKHEFLVSLGGYQSNTNRCKYCKSSITDGELRIHKYLQNHNIKFEAQKRYLDCKDKKPLPFDVYVSSKNCCIEFDGIQHTKPIRGEEQLKKTQLHDAMKNQYCIDNKIKLIRIPYFYYNQIEEILDEDLLGITNHKPIKIIPKFRIK